MTPDSAAPHYTQIVLPSPDSIQVTDQSHPYATQWGTQTAMRQDQAVAALDYLKTHEPSDWADFLNLASAFYLTHQDDLALEYSLRAVALHRSTPTLLNLAICLELRGEFSAAFPLAEEAHLRDPHDSIAGGLYADALIRNGDWAKGWPLHTHYHHGLAALRDYLPEWDGQSSLADRRILVLEGGGFGDNILVLRWAAILKKTHSAKRVTYGAPRNLIPLLRQQSSLAPFIDEFIPSFWEEIRAKQLARVDLSQFDCFISSLALPEFAFATPDDLHSPVRYPYFHAYPPQSHAVAAAFESIPRHVTSLPRVGLCWQAGEGAYPRKYKSLSDIHLRLITDTPGIEFISLQYGADSPSPILAPPIRDWSDTAAIIDNLDLVVTVDTGVAHLAGAMGVPTWLLLPGRSSWPFLLDRTDSPLYPSMRLFRNHTLGIDHAVRDVIAALEAL